MGPLKNSWLDFFSSLREGNIRFNPKPWVNPLNIPAESVVFSGNDIHGEIARKVDELIAQMDSSSSSWEEVSEEIQTVMKL